MDGIACQSLEIVLGRIANWSFPPTDWERRVAAKLARLPRVEAVRLNTDDLLPRGYQPHRCHENAVLWCESHPEYVPVKGWWLSGGAYALHSVVRKVNGGPHICVTPPEPALELPPILAFVPDPLIELRPGPNQGWYRAGRRIGPGIRVDPEKFIAELEAQRDRLLMPPKPMP